jgi:hypothetical protein
MKVTPELLRQVQIDNIRDHQIGGEQDGMSKKQAYDLGFMATEQVVELIHDIEAQPTSVPGRKPTIAEMNANERAHIAKAREDRRNSGF